MPNVNRRVNIPHPINSERWRTIPDRPHRQEAVSTNKMQGIKNFGKWWDRVELGTRNGVGLVIQGDKQGQNRGRSAPPSEVTTGFPLVFIGFSAVFCTVCPPGTVQNAPTRWVAGPLAVPPIFRFPLQNFRKKSLISPCGVLNELP